MLSEFFKFGDEFGKKVLNNVKNPFWKDTFECYFKYLKKYTCKTLNELDATSFLFNSNITVGNKPITSKYMSNKDLYQIGQLKENDRYLTLQELNTKFNTNLNFLHYRSLLGAIKTYTSKFQNLKSKSTLEKQPFLNLIISCKKGAARIYQEILEETNDITGLKKCITKMSINKDLWLKSFNILKKSTKDTKLWWIQFRILHQILTTNRSVSKFKPEQNHLCSFCNAHSETIQHLFWECRKTKQFWISLSEFINKRAIHSHNFRFTHNLVFFGVCDSIQTDNICNLIILMAKFYIYRCKVQKNDLNLKVFILELYNRYSIEKCIKKNSLVFRTSWAPYDPLFKSLL